MYTTFEAVRAEALFASTLQPSDRPGAPEARQAVAASVSAGTLAPTAFVAPAVTARLLNRLTSQADTCWQRTPLNLEAGQMTCVGGTTTTPGMAEQQPPSFPEWTATRIARPARDLARSTYFYRNLLGLAVLGGFTGHDEYDGVFFALPGGAELEITAGPAEPASSTDEDLP